MRIGIVGAGAVGCWYGGLLSLTGHEVHLHSRGMARTLREHGLTLEDANGRRTAPIAGAHEAADSIGPCDLVVVTLKATANASLPALIKPLLKDATAVLTLQNGMGNVEALERIVPSARVAAGLCFVCINRLPDGSVRNMLPGHVRVASASGPAGPTARLCSEALASAGVDCRTEDSLDAVLWKKLCWNIPFNGLSIASGGLTTDRILADRALRGRALGLMLEVSAAAEACGHPFDRRHVEWQFQVTDGMGPYRPSSLIDYLEGRDVEVDGIWAEPLRRGTAAGVRMPELTRLLWEVRERVDARGRPSRS